LDLVEYSNEEGPGPTNNMQEDPGSTLIMRAVRVYPEPLSRKAGGRKPDAWTSPTIKAGWAEPLSPLHRAPPSPQ
jgi:hypothetical protein